MEKTLTKDELNKLFGKESTWNPNRLVSKAGYVSGVPAFDILLDGKLFTEVMALINLNERPKGLEIEMRKGFSLKTNSIGLDKSDITKISLEDKDQIFEQKEKSIIGRAVIGGFLAGPAGLLIGGMTGVGTKVVKADMPDLFLTIEFSTPENGIQVIILSCPYKEKMAIIKYLQGVFPNKLNVELALNEN